ncbi:MASE1 domain-containing protein [Stenotrophomonas bentonitica]
MAMHRSFVVIRIPILNQELEINRILNCIQSIACVRRDGYLPSETCGQASAWDALEVRWNLLFNWLKIGMQLKLQKRLCPDGLLVAALYSLSCWCTRQISVDQLYLGAGVRISALLLCPRHLWPYLLLGEYAYFALLRYPLVNSHGLAWVVLGSAFLMPAAMAIAAAHRGVLARAPEIWLLSVASCAAVVVTLLNLTMAQLLWPTPPSLPISTRAVRYVLGDFMGILTLAPLALLWTRRNTDQTWHARSSTAYSALTALLVLGFCSTQIPPQYAAATSAMHLAMVLPAILLTRRHGWWGAAISLPLMSLSIGLSITSTGLPASFDLAIFNTQQSFAVVAVSLVVLGASISHYHDRSERRVIERRQAISLTRTSEATGESHLRMRALDINRIGDGIDRYLSETADWMTQQGHPDAARCLVNTASLYSRKFREQTSMVYPAILEHVGLYLALQAGGVSGPWANTGRLATPRLTGDPCRLPVTLQLAAYRTVTETVYLLLQSETSLLRIKARCGRWKELEGILVVVELVEKDQRLSEGTCALAVERLTGRTLSYGGTLECRQDRIRMLFVDTI